MGVMILPSMNVFIVNDEGTLCHVKDSGCSSIHQKTCTA
jgi:hypothetical protein